ncbi:solute carrier family 30 (zinc transporter), member 1 [Geosmithia morbida]|uniref:Solute carrier family 30 (Zinc transporter), member 1 n=1 Tax=Geosmithia morbida TaxID=1094350 RepID=A0A9P4Z0K8_9HYPO|nr:solute carrier family 30 (zinc transporter), member 1 [Geosmithia morbida]KAF4125212.1 solute carrier family 30 (zinc transporter), member 1 [Geosmithia morbida]
MSFKMVWSKSTRIKVMIAIDLAFFLLELIVGLLAHSLALTADAFHMLNDIISLVIGLWAVVAAQKASTDEFTFGWVRAEILGAFFNAVFLIALCVSIILEAVTRFVEPPVINNPQLILIVGCAGLFSNLVGFVVLGGHGHSHGPGGGHDHDHDHGHPHSHGEHDHDHGHSHDDEEERIGSSRGFAADIADENGDVADVFPESIVYKTTDAAADSQPRNRGRRQSSRSGGHSRFTSIGDMSIHPASFRKDIIAVSRAAASPDPEDSETEEDNDEHHVHSNDKRASPHHQHSEGAADESSPLLKKDHGHEHGHGHGHGACEPVTSVNRKRRDSSVHVGHNHTLPKDGSKGGGHSHDDMGMNAMVLHVIGDALGNIGVIVTALIIWLTDLPGKYYADPAVSLVITAIILKTAVPLTRATSKILLQATPDHISVPEIREDIEALPGVVTCHHMHIWQLSDTKVVASMHLEVSFPLDSDSGAKYMQLAKRARKCLHGFGIHSATIQPEFFLDRSGNSSAAPAGSGGADGSTVVDTPAATTPPLDPPQELSGREVCLLECIDNCDAPGCCPSIDGASTASSTRRASGSSQH